MRTKFLSKNRLFFLVNLLSVYLILLLIRGFSYAANDVVDVMAYAKYLSNPSLYPFDFYIQHIAKTIPNERIFFSGFLSFFNDQISWLSLIFHLIASLFLLSGIYAIAKQFITSIFFRWMVPLLLFGPLYGLGPGDCELYYNMFIASLAAKSIGIWAIYYFIKLRVNLAYLLLIPVTFIHPTVGAQLFLIFLSISIFLILFKKHHRSLFGILIYLLTAGVWIILLQLNVHEESIVNKDLVFEIFEFRLAHHFFPKHFSTNNIFFGCVIGISGLILALIKNQLEIAAFFAITLDGMILYTLSMLYFPNELILSSQWFKSFIWLEMFAVVLLLSIFEKLITGFMDLKFHDKWLKHSVWALGLVVLVAFNLDLSFFEEKRYDLFFKESLSEEAEIALLAKKTTPGDAVFVVPMEFTEFKFYSERSLFIDYKSVVHRKDALPEWYKRIQLVYDIDISDRRNEKNLYSEAKSNFIMIAESHMEDFKNEGIDYIVNYKSYNSPLPVVAETDSYRIYKISDH